ncbi:hypothetical protein BC832DRAFT_588978 [Gaertneriomyces semiglobifer]|nr:hypothetical protein BC832DRAFT_588978 [Gaertneriomyces semiglobifer]
MNVVGTSAAPAAESFDFICVGSGMGASIVAKKLLDVKKYSVLVLEAGVESLHAPEVEYIDTQVLVARGAKFAWNFTTIPEPGLLGKTTEALFGRLTGGSSAHNSGQWTRGSPEDYNEYAKLMNDSSWEYHNLKNVFEQLEASPKDSDFSLRGKRGVFPLTRVDSDDYTSRLLKAGPDAGYEPVVDYNSALGKGKTDVISPFEFVGVEGRRSSSYEANLGDAVRKGNKYLTVRTQAFVTKIIIDPQTKRATGVEYRDETTGQIKIVQVKKEVIVGAGAINTPKILQLSGIGNPDLLEKHGIPVIAENNAVGENLSNGMGVPVFYLANRALPVRTYYNQAVIWGSLKDGGRVDYEIMVSGRRQAQWGALAPAPVGLEQYRAIHLNAILSNPKARGHVYITSADVDAPAEILNNYLADPLNEDVEKLRQVAEHAIEYGSSRLLASEYSLKRVIPAEGQVVDHDYVRRNAVGLSHHLGTCSMGTCVDSSFSVRGVKGVRIGDGSLIPFQPAGHPMAVVAVAATKLGNLLAKEYSGHHIKLATAE